MLTRMRKTTKAGSEGGFTLIELLVVIIIIGILAAIAIPMYLSQRQKGYDATAESDLKNMSVAQESWFTDNGSYGTLANIQSAAGGYVKSSTVTPAVVATSNAGYCISATDTRGSATTWYMDTRTGGGAPTKTACN